MASGEAVGLGPVNRGGMAYGMGLAKLRLQTTVVDLKLRDDASIGGCKDGVRKLATFIREQELPRRLDLVGNAS